MSRATSSGGQFSDDTSDSSRASFLTGGVELPFFEFPSPLFARFWGNWRVLGHCAKITETKFNLAYTIITIIYIAVKLPWQ